MIKPIRKALSKILSFLAFPFGYAFIAITILSALVGGNSWNKIEGDLNAIDEALNQMRSSRKKRG